MSTPTFIITIAPGRNGKATMFVSLRGADGAPAGPPREVILDNRLAGFVASAQAFARQQLAALKASAEGRTEDRDPTIAVEAANGKQVG